MEASKGGRFFRRHVQSQRQKSSLSRDRSIARHAHRQREKSSTTIVSAVRSVPPRPATGHGRFLVGPCLRRSSGGLRIFCHGFQHFHYLVNQFVPVDVGNVGVGRRSKGRAVPKGRTGRARCGCDPGSLRRPERPRRSIRDPRKKGALAHRFRTWSALILIGTVLSSCSTSSATSVPLTTSSRAGCGNSAFGSLHQSMNGQVVGCLQVGVLDAGPHYVVLDQVLLGGEKGAGVTGTATTVQSPGAGGVTQEPGVALSLSPVSGAPGSRITVTGRVTSPIPGASADLGGGAHANLCWDGCDGLQYQGVPLQWTSPTTFRARLVVPAAPWIEQETDSVHRLASGTYPIGIQCLEPMSGCALGGSEGSTDFRLQVAKSAVTLWCRTDSSCAHLAVTPRRARPGEVVRVTGYAPLESVIGSDEPFTFELQVLEGHPRGPEVKFNSPTRELGAVDVSLGHGAVEVAAPPAWRSLPQIDPLAEIDAGLAPISADPAHPSTVAWCGSGSVIVSGASGLVQVPTASAARTLIDMGLASLGTGEVPGGASQTTCVTALPLGTPSDDDLGESPAVVVAAFVVAPDGEAPPTADVALFTTNDGQTWTPLPAPPGTDPTAFGGFRVQGQDLEALFSAATTGVESPQPLVETSSDGGHTWHTSGLSCPTEGPCVMLGAYASGNCAMSGTSQAVLRSTNSGQRWTQIGWPATVNACAPAELVATSPHTELLVASASPYTLTRSIDNGTTWSDIGLPALPGEDVAAGLGLGPGGIILLPDGALLATGEQGRSTKWELLPPGATSWCSVRGVSSAEQRSALYSQVELIGTQIWWLSAPDQSAPVAHHLPAADPSC